jgi:hypothetical protein
MPMPVTETETPAAHVTTHAAMLDTVPPIPPAPVRADGRLQIPQSLVALTQPAGQKRLMGTNDKQSYWPLSAHFETQKNQAYCSVATSVMALNALDIQRPKNTLYPDFPYFTQEDFFRSIDPQLANPEKVAQEGMTLDQLSAVLGHFPITVLKYHASDLTLEQFRELIRTTASHSDRFALLNFKRTLIGEVGGGHWSPLAAFDAATDSALLLDVARYKYPAVWVPVTQLYEAALAVDDDSGLARGLIVIGKP